MVGVGASEQPAEPRGLGYPEDIQQKGVFFFKVEGVLTAQM